MTQKRILFAATPHDPAISPTQGICRLMQEVRGRCSWPLALAVFSIGDKDLVSDYFENDIPIWCFEETMHQYVVSDDVLSRLETDYPTIPWGNVVAAERNFGDYSFLQGATGFRGYDAPKVWDLIARMAIFFEEVLSEFCPDSVFTFIADNVFTDIATFLTEARGIELILPQISQLAEPDQLPGGFFGRTRYCDSFRFIRNYNRYCERDLTVKEFERAKRFRHSVACYDVTKMYKLRGIPGRALPISPRWQKVLQNPLRFVVAGKNVGGYGGISISRKITANLLRTIRFVLGNWFFRCRTTLPQEPFLYFPLHFQPEASTLINGLYYTNQIALIEQISKSLPLGVMLVVKEHEKGRGNRPLWQYKYIESFYNVRLTDLPSREVVRSCNALITISGTTALEALAQDKPVIVLGRKFYFFAELFHFLPDVKQLPFLLKQLFFQPGVHHDERKLDAYFLAWLDTQFAIMPIPENLSKLAEELLSELNQNYEAERDYLAARYGA